MCARTEVKIQSVAAYRFKLSFKCECAALKRIAVAAQIDLAVFVGGKRPETGGYFRLVGFTVADIVPAYAKISPMTERVVVNQIDCVFNVALLAIFTVPF